MTQGKTVINFNLNFPAVILAFSALPAIGAQRKAEGQGTNHADLTLNACLGSQREPEKND